MCGIGGPNEELPGCDSSNNDAGDAKPRNPSARSASREQGVGEIDRGEEPCEAHCQSASDEKQKLGCHGCLRGV